MSPFMPSSEWPSQDPSPPHSIAFLSLPERMKLLTMSRAETNLDALKNQVKRIFGGIWRYSCTFSSSAWCSGLVWWLYRTRATQSQVSPPRYLFREHLRGRRAQGGRLSRRFDSYCSLKWAAQPNVGHSFPPPARSAAVLALVKGLPKHLPSIKS